jgi:prepilin-type N-terminal cleavage/methylation domain-containing protein
MAQLERDLGSHATGRIGRPARRRSQRGFTLVELLVVVAIVGTLAAVAIQQGGDYTARSRRVEAYLVLNALYSAQLIYFGRTDKYAASFSELGFTLDGGTNISPTEIKGRTYTFTISQPWGPVSFYCMASANLDSDDWPDVLVITQGEP